MGTRTKFKEVVENIADETGWSVIDLAEPIWFNELFLCNRKEESLF